MIYSYVYVLFSFPLPQWEYKSHDYLSVAYQMKSENVLILGYILTMTCT